jgi:DNA polymerase-3 subunit epsilon
MLTDDAAAALALQLEQHPNYRILRRLVPRTDFAEPDGRPQAKGVVVDTETTGFNLDNDKIIEVGLVVFDYDPETGQVYRVLDTYGCLEDPKVPISPEITEITGITDGMVEGMRIDEGKVTEMVAGASLVIAHNSKFDRPFLERRFPVFETVPWGCSFSQVDWIGEGLGTRKLDYIAAQFGFFFDAHRAEMDCLALLQILQQPLPKSRSIVLKSLLDKLPQKDWTVFALNSPFETKDTLKSRGYQWDANRKVWHRTVTGSDDITVEVAWLKEVIYKGRNVSLDFEVRDALLRYSLRPGKTVTKAI